MNFFHVCNKEQRTNLIYENHDTQYDTEVIMVCLETWLLHITSLIGQPPRVTIS